MYGWLMVGNGSTYVRLFKGGKLMGKGLVERSRWNYLVGFAP